MSYLCGKMSKDKEETQSEVTLSDFIVPQKIVAFCDAFEPADIYRLDGELEIFTDYRLRSYFKAVPCQLGDPLSIYIERLENQGFKMRDTILGEPAILCKRKINNEEEFLL